MMAKSKECSRRECVFVADARCVEQLVQFLVLATGDLASCERSGWLGSFCCLGRRCRPNQIVACSCADEHSDQVGERTVGYRPSTNFVCCEETYSDD